MADTSRVTLVPIIRALTKSIVGAINLGGFEDFVGTEPDFELPSGKTITLTKWTPNSANSDGRNAQWFMAMVIDETNYLNRAFEGYAEFVPLADLEDTTIYTSSNGLPNQKSYTPGALIDVLSNKSFRPL